MPTNLSPFVAMKYKYCFECRERFPLDKVIETHPVEGLTVYLCAGCHKKPEHATGSNVAKRTIVSREHGNFAEQTPL